MIMCVFFCFFLTVFTQLFLFYLFLLLCFHCYAFIKDDRWKIIYQIRHEEGGWGVPGCILNQRKVVFKRKLLFKTCIEKKFWIFNEILVKISNLNKILVKILIFNETCEKNSFFNEDLIYKKSKFSFEIAFFAKILLNFAKKSSFYINFSKNSLKFSYKKEISVLNRIYLQLFLYQNQVFIKKTFSKSTKKLNLL